jgi:medium-chain acyl-[acyl-carrier-protein] hydrolase
VPAGAGSQRNLWLPYYKPKPGARLTLFCLHHAGGAASAYRAWRDSLPDAIDVAAVQLPGREARLSERPLSSAEAAVAAMVDGLALERLDHPFAIFGHSVGGRLAFELTRQLRRSGRQLPVHLFVSGTRAPHVPRRGESIHRLPDAELVAALEEYGGTPPQVLSSRELMELLLPMLRADFTISEEVAYRAEAPLPMPITALGGLADDDVTIDDLEAWREHTSADFQRHMLPGGHFFVSSQAAEVVRLVATELLRA